MIYLDTLDLRNNSLIRLPTWLADLEKLERLTVHGNPVCTNGWLESAQCPGKLKAKVDIANQGCTPQCSSVCLNDLLQNKHCWYQCNSKKCKYSNGWC